MGPKIRRTLQRTLKIVMMLNMRKSLRKMPKISTRIRGIRRKQSKISMMIQVMRRKAPKLKVNLSKPIKREVIRTILRAGWRKRTEGIGRKEIKEVDIRRRATKGEAIRRKGKEIEGALMIMMVATRKKEKGIEGALMIMMAAMRKNAHNWISYMSILYFLSF